MANNNAPFGFRQYSGTGSSPTYEQITVGPGGISGGIAYNAGAIYCGDPVVRAADQDGVRRVRPRPGPGRGPGHRSSAVHR